MRITTLAAAAFLAPSIALAASSGSTNPPKTTKTTTECKAGQVFDTKTAQCVDKSSNLIDDDTRYGAVRELAYAGLYDRASGVLDEMDATDSRVMTYRGFIARKTGDMEAAMTFYTAAIEANANNILARSYMGQGMAEAGDRVGAKLQLAEIRTRGGRNTWAEIALRNAIQTGTGSNY
ncbi:hypothetical protein [uncultured Litoreibacter sp.]|uniref:tetratricopeptide repeat protein n=1 Tax=uncultured Litoreibacter sp. TaxID=1392394 RepID=UPI00262B05F1|nr:hypothetical protein [uncultured Litoreibacter sp.]